MYVGFSSLCLNADATGVATLHTRVTVYVGFSSLCVNADAMGVAALHTG